MSVSSTSNVNTVMYWNEGDLVKVYFQHMIYVGVLDGWSFWPEKRHHDPYPCVFTGVCMWPVRVRNLTHQHIAIHNVEVHHVGAYIIENKSLTKRASVIQRHWRLYHTKRIVAARMIQRVWKECISNPYHNMCQHRLLHEFTGMHPVVSSSPPSCG